MSQMISEKIYLYNSYRQDRDLDEIPLTQAQIKLSKVIGKFHREVMPEPLASQAAGYTRVASCAVMQSTFSSEKDPWSSCMQWEEAMRRWGGDVSLRDPRPLMREALVGLKNLKSDVEDFRIQISYTASMLGRGISESIQESVNEAGQWWGSKSTLQKAGYVIGVIAIGAAAVYLPPLAAAVL